jgi:hypothetical protein
MMLFKRGPGFLAQVESSKFSVDPGRLLAYMQCVLLTYSGHASINILFNLDYNGVWGLLLST